MRNIYRFIFFFLSFGVARGALFVGPLVLANILSPADYGTLEFVQALASILSILLALGTASVVPLIIVRGVQRVSLRGVLSHQTAGALSMLILAVCFFTFDFSPVSWLCAFAIGALMLQLLWSVTLRSSGHGEASLVLDAGFWGVLALAAFGAFIFGFDRLIRWRVVEITLIFYFSILFVWTFRKLAQVRASNMPLLYGQTLSAGFPLMVGTLLSFLATTSGRVGVGLLSTPEVTADYAILFRATAIPMVAHQIVMVAKFRQIFAVPEDELRRKLPLVAGLVTITVLTFWVLSEFLTVLLGPAFGKAFLAHPKTGLLVLVQCILWSGIAVNETINNRAQTARSVIFPACVYFFVAFSCSWWFLSRHEFSLDYFVLVHSFVMVGYFLVQALVMLRRGLNFARTWAVTLASFLSLSALVQII